MNRKLLAATVAAAVTAPAGVYAQDGPEVTIYGQVQYVLIDSDIDNDEPAERDVSTTDVNENDAIRFGMRISSDLGNGMTALGQYEATTHNDGDTVNQLRLAWVGLEGSFGQFTVGQQYSAYNEAIGFVEPFYQNTPGLDGDGSNDFVSLVNGATGVSRTGSTLQYSNSFGPLSLGIDVRVDDDDDVADNGLGDRDSQGDGFGIGLSVNPMENLTIAAAYDHMDGRQDHRPLGAGAGENGEDEADVDAYGFAVGVTVGDLWINGGWQTQETDSVSAACHQAMNPDMDCADATDTPHLPIEEIEADAFQINAGYQINERSSVYAGYGEVEVDNNTAGEPNEESKSFALGTTYNLGGGLVFYAEYWDQNTDNQDHGIHDVDSNTLWIGMNLSF